MNQEGKHKRTTIVVKNFVLKPALGGAFIATLMWFHESHSPEALASVLSSFTVLVIAFLE